MKIMRLFASVLILTMLFGCASQTIQIKPASDQEKLPSPSFTAKDLTKSGQTPMYSQIIVYQIDECTIPNCPIVWHVVVSRSSSPRKIVYGGLPSVGAVTVVGYQDLKKGGTYRLILDQEKHVPDPGTGSISFRVNSEGKIVVLGL